LFVYFGGTGAVFVVVFVVVAGADLFVDVFDVVGAGALFEPVVLLVFVVVAGAAAALFDPVAAVVVFEGAAAALLVPA
jgi:hypothetical protein